MSKKRKGGGPKRKNRKKNMKDDCENDCEKEIMKEPTYQQYESGRTYD